ncbi:thiamine pyrophosphate-binding protein [Streptomyces sp. LHD-70]|uniref:thiamine pyrophosphate-dependent enzyme n=1 Tax=Streptomyces sp. LHD-70 TaxID=3072140 RepID=UPI00280E7E90|nr:thiamine pyrophosphate-dependent enzyme [Streptomyces sp. LHD-70]MDQ8702532.1 thiamine pyrophosphate-binding protein [Streptomyces sp. LHD-70]
MSNAESPERPLSAGHLIVAQLEREGIQRVYGVPGESFLDVLDGLHDSPISTVVTRHEGGAGFMALAEGRLTGLPGVAMVTRGPGAANAFIAVHTAYQDATPMILFVGLIPVADRGREAFQEFDLSGWFGSTAKKVVMLDDPAAASRVVAESVHTACSGRPGPVVIGLPEDVLTQPTGTSRTVQPLEVPRPRVAEADVKELVHRLERAKRPLVVVGGEGWTAESGQELIRWTTDHSIPVLADFRAYDAVPHDLEGAGSFVGSLGYGRSDHAARLLDEADLTVLLGTPRGDVLSDGYTRGLDSETVLVLPGDARGHCGRIDQFIAAHAPSLALDLVTTPTAPDADVAWFKAARVAHDRFRTPVPESAADSAHVDLTAVMAVLREELAPDAVITYGAGNHALWPARYLSHGSPASLIAPRNGAMGMGIPAAVAAALTFPEREVVSVAGDGCFLMNGQETATAVGYGAAFVALVVDNGCYATIREHQENAYPDRPSGTHLTNPDFAAWARSYGAYGETVRSADDFREAYRRARASGLPAVLHLVQDPAVRAPGSAD